MMALNTADQSALIKQAIVSLSLCSIMALINYLALSYARYLEQLILILLCSNPCNSLYLITSASGL